MPSIPISFDSAINALNTPQREKSTSDYSTIVSTPLGLTLIEIQGELSIPREKPIGLNESEQKLFDTIALPEIFTNNINNNKDGIDNNDHDDYLDVVKFGKLEIDESMKKATLFISTTQRLIGTIEKIDPPLGLLKIDHENTPSSGGNITNDTTNTTTTKSCQMLDVIETKIIFKNRPLPIM